MLDYQRIADEVRSALLNNGQQTDDLLRGAAADYCAGHRGGQRRGCGSAGPSSARACGARRSSSARSSRTSWTSWKRSTFPSARRGTSCSRSAASAPAPQILLDVAASLNEAYSVEQPLAPLLQRHRLLAMSHGPLKLRIEVLRNLADADAENSIWDQDVRTFEEERVKELRKEIPQAIADGDVAALDALDAEIEAIGLADRETGRAGPADCAGPGRGRAAAQGSSTCGRPPTA